MKSKLLLAILALFITLSFTACGEDDDCCTQTYPTLTEGDDDCCTQTYPTVTVPPEGDGD